MSKLLIIGNLSDQQSMLRYFLETKEYVVRTVNNAIDLFTEICNYKPDLLLLDTCPDDAEGRDICQRLRNSPETRHLGILIFTNSRPDPVKYKFYYADDFLEKPYNLEVLAEKIRSLLSWTPIRKKALSGLSKDTGVKIPSEQGHR